MGEGTIIQDDDLLKELHELDLSRCHFGDDGMQAICRLIRSDMAIDTLTLASNPAVSLKGWQALGQALKKTRTLETLTLDQNNIGNRGIDEITSGLYENSSLSTLDINHVGITEEGGKCIVDLLKRNILILEINLDGNKLSEQLREDIKKYISLNKTMPVD